MSRANNKSTILVLILVIGIHSLQACDLNPEINKKITDQFDEKRFTLEKNPDQI